MSREHKSRGKRRDNGEWAYGPAIKCSGGQAYIVDRVYSSLCGNPIASLIEVDPATVGDFTGQQDRTGKEIFEGDKQSSGTESKYLDVCEWHKLMCAFIWRSIDDPNDWHAMDDCGIGEVIGNILDPEPKEKPE